LALDIIDLVVILIMTIIGVAALVIVRFKVEPSKKKQYKKFSPFLIMGGSWSIVGFVLGTLYRGDGILDNTLLMLGLIFLFAGGIGVIAEYFKS
jgi:predicted membrane channel-forming protein YqfA (hemolysin III family)